MQKSNYFEDFEGHDRFAFPEPLVRVTGGSGGEAILLLLQDAAVLYDCGMACYKDQLIRNLRDVLDRENRTLDHIILSHSHYDHIGALPYVLQEWPNVDVCAGAKAAEVFTKPGALATMERLGNAAKKKYGMDHVEITAQGMRVDTILKDGDVLRFGEQTITAYEAKGHTDCSMIYLLEPEGILFTCESTGIATGPHHINTSPLKSIADTIASAEKQRALKFEYLLVPHYGLYCRDYNHLFFDRYIEAVKAEEELINDCFRKGLSEEEACEVHKAQYWTPQRAKEQPYDAYALNTGIIIKQVYKQLRQA